MRGFLMVLLEASFVGLNVTFVSLKKWMSEQQFVLGGNWDYRGGCFDRALDEERTLFLRVPFTVMEGELDAEDDGQDTVVKLGSPFLLRHLYQKGTDETARMRLGGALFDQFQTPQDVDAPLDNKERWVAEGNRWIALIQKRFNSR
jgi:hypothetical protein